MRMEFRGAIDVGLKKAGNLNFFRKSIFSGLPFYNRLLITLAVVTSAPLFADSTLIKDKKPVCNIIVSKNAGPVEKHAADELSKFLGKISGGEKPTITETPDAKLYPIRFELTNDDNAIDEEGFRLKADKNGCVIKAKNPRGFIYGAYEILKKYGGIHWLVPGDDGEYFTVKPTITIPDLDSVSNPSCKTRYFGPVEMSIDSPIWDTWDWSLRNNMHLIATHLVYSNPALTEGLNRRGVIKRTFYHNFSPLLHGTGLNGLSAAEEKKEIEKTFKEHPERFALINGKRVISYDFGPRSPQPCTSNKEVIDIFAKNILRWQSPEFLGADGIIYLCGNDTIAWCQCEECRKIDLPEEAKKGIVSTRYWTFVNQVIERAFMENPKVRLGPITYQTYSTFPLGVKPDSRFCHTMLGNHRRCWRHHLDDPNCPTNHWYRNYNLEWNKGGASLYTYEEIVYAAGVPFIPTEKNWVDTLKYYHANAKNISGMMTEITPPDGRYGAKTYSPDPKQYWHRMWQAMYMGYAFMWNIDRDYDKMYEEINSLYYGKGWAGGMKDFRALLLKASTETPGCWGYGHAAQLGKCLEAPGVHEKLLKYLDGAETAAKGDSDPRALKHVQMDREFFKVTWEKAYTTYINDYRDIRAYRSQAPIKIDGVLDEADWKNADIVSRFKQTDSDKLAEQQTSVKITYDSDNIYLGIECLDSATSQMKTTVKTHDGPVWEDNTLEIFINNPILGGAYYQLIFNADGVLCDMLMTPGQREPGKEFESNATFKSTFQKDRWIAEIRIPTAPILGEKCKDGEVLKINIARNRFLVDGSREVSTWSSGDPQSVEVFHPVSFVGKRGVDGGSRQELDNRAWKNSTFAEVQRLEKPRPDWDIKDNLVPKSWFLSTTKFDDMPKLEMVKVEGSNDYFVKLRDYATIYQYFESTAEKLKMFFKTSGKGQLDIFAFREIKEDGKTKVLPVDKIATLDIDSTDWKSQKLEYVKKDKNERIALAFRVDPPGLVCIDDVFVAPAE